MYVNNEIGVINPIDEIKKIVKKYDKVKLHFDMVQALGKLPIDLNEMCIRDRYKRSIESLPPETPTHTLSPS